MKLSRKHRLTIIVIIAATLILYGILDRIFTFNVNPKTVNNVSMFLMIGAFALLFSERRGKGTEPDKPAEKDQEDQENP
jgi:hypothetical protein